MAAPILSFENLGLSQGSHWLFRHIDIHVGQRDRLALIGRNGAGKTTLLKLIGGQIEADEGIRSVQPGARVVTLEQDPDVSAFKTLHDFALAGAFAPPAHEVEAIADQLGIDLSREAATASGGERRRAAIARALDRLSKLSIAVVHKPELGFILADARARARRGAIGLLVIDYVQLVAVERDRGETRDQQIGEITRSLKAFSMEHRVPVLAAAQIRRIHAQRTGRDPRPTLEDLRESGNLEHDANTVLLIFRPGTVPGTDEYEARDRRKTELLIAKQRGGMAYVSTPLVADFEHARFLDGATDAEEEQADLI